MAESYLDQLLLPFVEPKQQQVPFKTAVHASNTATGSSATSRQADSEQHRPDDEKMATDYVDSLIMAHLLEIKPARKISLSESDNPNEASAMQYIDSLIARSIFH